MTARRVVLLGEEVLRIPTEKIKGFGEETQGLIEDLLTQCIMQVELE